MVGRLSYRLPNVIEQNTIVNNVATLPDTTPGQMQAREASHRVRARGPPAMGYNLVQGTTGSGGSEPKFADTLHYYLAPGSPAIDAGDPASAADPSSGGEASRPAMGGKRADIGAYGGEWSSPLLP
ncbi:MAG: choice-of-anchor Q domain-containing protein [Gemmatimonadales bacterium]